MARRGRSMRYITSGVERESESSFVRTIRICRLYSSRWIPRDCLFARTNRMIANRLPEAVTCLSGRLSIFRFLRNSITLQDNWINSEFYYACRRWLSWMSFASRHSFDINVVFLNINVMFLIRLLLIVNFRNRNY